MTNIIDQYTDAPRRYQLLDGSGEMTMGVSFLFFALINWLSDPDGIGIWKWLLAFYAGPGALWALTHFGTRFIRRRLVYPRSGYLKVRKRPWELAFLALLSGVIGAGMAAYSAKPDSRTLSPILAMAFLFGIACLIAALRYRTRKFVVYAAISIAIGLLLQSFEPPVPPDTGIRGMLLILRSSAIWYFLIMGVLYLVGGALALYLYAQHNPKRDVEAE
jgi:hypothetical protein